MFVPAEATCVYSGAHLLQRHSDEPRCQYRVINALNKTCADEHCT